MTRTRLTYPKTVRKHYVNELREYQTDKDKCTVDFTKYRTHASVIPHPATIYRWKAKEDGNVWTHRPLKERQKIAKMVHKQGTKKAAEKYNLTVKQVWGIADRLLRKGV